MLSPNINEPPLRALRDANAPCGFLFGGFPRHHFTFQRRHVSECAGTSRLAVCHKIGRLPIISSSSRVYGQSPCSIIILTVVRAIYPPHQAMPIVPHLPSTYSVYGQDADHPPGSCYLLRRPGPRPRSLRQRMDGEVEADETFVGGLKWHTMTTALGFKKMRHGIAEGEGDCVFRLVQRGTASHRSRVRAFIVPNQSPLGVSSLMPRHPPGLYTQAFQARLRSSLYPRYGTAGSSIRPLAFLASWIPSEILADDQGCPRFPQS